MSFTKFAHFFNEGAGYLFVDNLGSGTQGQTMLVLSVADNKIYVRKRMFPGLLRASELPTEVSLYIPYPFIPTLIDWTDSGLAIHTIRHGMHVNESTSIWQYCNGGDLADFIDKYDGNAVRHLAALEEFIPEALIWRFFDQLLGTLTFIQHRHPPLVHRDLCPGNVFLHWSSDDSELPDFFLGDFGHASVVDLTTQGSSTNQASKHRTRIFSNDLKTLGDCLIKLISHTREIEPGRPSSTPYSQELFDCYFELFEVAEASEKSGGTLPDFKDLLERVKAAAMASSSSGMSSNARLTKPIVNKTPMLYESRDEILRARKPAGPWYIAAVDARTFLVIDIEEEPNNLGVSLAKQIESQLQDGLHLASEDDFKQGPTSPESSMNSSDQRNMDEFFAEQTADMHGDE